MSWGDGVKGKGRGREGGRRERERDQLHFTREEIKFRHVCECRRRREGREGRERWG